MKSRYLDLHNCKALLPNSHGLPILKRLDKCLTYINEEDLNTSGSITRLIDRNKQNPLNSKNRLSYSSPIEISQKANLLTRELEINSIKGPSDQPALLHVILSGEIFWKAVIPLQYLLKGWGNANDGYQCYVHTISYNTGPKMDIEQYLQRFSTNSKDDYYYVGITGRNWLKRLDEHMSEIRRGNRRRFYSAWKEGLGINDVQYISVLKHVNKTYEEAMTWEEHAVDKIAYGSQGLNMIAGGFKGLKQLHRLGLTARENISLQEREKAITEYIRKYPRAGIPNPLISELWKDDEFYLKVLKNRNKTLTPDQVKSIRILNVKGLTIEEITKKVNALNERQVRNVINGITYKRMD